MKVEQLGGTFNNLRIYLILKCKKNNLGLFSQPVIFKLFLIFILIWQSKITNRFSDSIAKKKHNYLFTVVISFQPVQRQWE